MSVPFTKIKEFVNESNCLKAMTKIDNEGIPKGREAKNYVLFNAGNHTSYPVKLVVEHAFNLAAIEKSSSLRLTPADFSSNRELRNYLVEYCNFEIEELSGFWA